MELTINIENYITPEEIKSIAMEAVRETIMRTYNRDEYNIARLISILSYEFIFKAVSDAIGEDAQTKITEHVKKLLEDGSSIRYEMWRKKDAWEKTESPAIPILNKAIKDNEGLIRAKVMQCIDSYNFDDVQGAMYNALEQILYKKANTKRQRAVKQIDVATQKVVAVYASMREAERKTGIKSTYICQVCKGKFKQCFGYSWCYVEVQG